jgi:hypothetical protein
MKAKEIIRLVFWFLVVSGAMTVFGCGGKKETPAEQPTAEVPTLTPIRPEASAADNSDLAEGELLYSGTAQLNYCDYAEVSFILSADKASLRDIKLKLRGFSYSDNRVTIRADSESQFYSKPEVINGTVDWTDSAWAKAHLTLTSLNTGEAAGEFSFTNKIDTGPGNYVYVDMGTVPITVKPVQ